LDRHLYLPRLARDSRNQFTNFGKPSLSFVNGA
jgi:hypothetical protein